MKKRFNDPRFLLVLLFGFWAQYVRADIPASLVTVDGVKRCLEFVPKRVVVEKSSTSVIMKVTKIKSVGHCGCKSKILRYRVSTIPANSEGDRIAEETMPRVHANMLEPDSKVQEVTLLLDSLELKASDGPISIHVSCYIPNG